WNFEAKLVGFRRSSKRNPLLDALAQGSIVDPGWGAELCGRVSRHSVVDEGLAFLESNGGAGRGCNKSCPLCQKLQGGLELEFRRVQKRAEPGIFGCSRGQTQSLHGFTVACRVRSCQGDSRLESLQGHLRLRSREDAEPRPAN